MFSFSSYVEIFAAPTFAAQSGTRLAAISLLKFVEWIAEARDKG